ncbi:alkanesulfonate monooxygenase SsuD/methylene tetrahydromethanopterin reductase-like flavin-dependent oxidoreductase (luciferase family) [Yimella lutea]|uniref:Alkanesulfonate monooxygenase SsuD/methylene tetrahydromethanopterin reductase-like flavin-dependent oxidoreductase (Luciferase family) n=1 Tax=Yimella lutea TaxID=587872 RepID=A0A542EE64_9MICO|nr:LLM class flavin-dependent oxidoreductase [Yimella lutea]TQJ13590.1 alkanesulfonate monooxygenase SsuD/methylene tetrahydromethanopterin reductase-like flavin-dependent oxidoreductase (luciferase family) [Yimella lutea]
MSTGRLSLLFGLQVECLDVLEQYGRWCEQDDRRLWLGQSTMIETHVALAGIAGRGVRIETGLAVAVAPLFTPTLAWVQARSVAHLMERPVCAGYGIGTMATAQALLGHPLSAPAGYVRDFVSEIGDFRAEEDEGSMGSRVSLGAGVLRPGMARRSATVCDFAVTWLTPLGYLSSTLMDAFDAGAEQAARPRPRVVSIVPAAVRRADHPPIPMAAISCGQHMQLPHYAQMLRGAGVDITGDVPHDLRETVRAGLFLYGSPDEIAARILEYFRSGVDEVVLNVGSVHLLHGLDAALSDAQEIADAVARATGEQDLTENRQQERNRTCSLV